MIPFLIITVIAVKDAGVETVSTSKNTEMYGGIYKNIRHPQMLGASPIILIICCLLNSLTLLILFSILIIIIVPIVIYFEEKDLIKRFGESYKEYKKETGAIIPKFWKRK
jgi:protein-S-isoprenylcysteine O-methyltransferase Ste14